MFELSNIYEHGHKYMEVEIQLDDQIFRHRYDGQLIINMGQQHSSLAADGYPGKFIVTEISNIRHVIIIDTNKSLVLCYRDSDWNVYSGKYLYHTSTDIYLWHPSNGLINGITGQKIDCVVIENINGSQLITDHGCAKFICNGQCIDTSVAYVIETEYWDQKYIHVLLCQYRNTEQMWITVNSQGIIDSRFVAPYILKKEIDNQSKYYAVTSDIIYELPCSREDIKGNMSYWITKQTFRIGNRIFSSRIDKESIRWLDKKIYDYIFFVMLCFRRQKLFKYVPKILLLNFILTPTIPSFKSYVTWTQYQYFSPYHMHEEYYS